MNAKTLWYKAKEQMEQKEIADQGDLGSDLYLKVTPISTTLIEQYDFKENVTKFKDQIDHELWYDVPFANVTYWEERGFYCGEVQI